MAGGRAAICDGGANPAWGASRRAYSESPRGGKRMKTYLDCWISAATTLFSQALVGEPQLTELKSIPPQVSGLAFVAEISGDVAGRFSITLEAQIVTAPLLGDGVDQAGGGVGI